MQVGGFDPQAVERVRAGYHHVISQNRAQLEWKHVQRARELVGRHQKRRGEPQIVPPGQAQAAGAQVVRDERFDHGQRVHERGVFLMGLAMAVARVVVFGRARMNAVGDKRPQASAEHLAQVAVERLHRRRNLGHMSIISACVSGS